MDKKLKLTCPNCKKVFNFFDNSIYNHLPSYLTTRTTSLTIAEYKKNLIKILIREGELKSEQPIPHLIKANHGNCCCCCIECKHPHEDCVCSHNRLLSWLIEAENE